MTRRDNNHTYVTILDILIFNLNMYWTKDTNAEFNIGEIITKQ